MMDPNAYIPKEGMKFRTKKNEAEEGAMQTATIEVPAERAEEAIKLLKDGGITAVRKEKNEKKENGPDFPLWALPQGC